MFVLYEELNVVGQVKQHQHLNQIRPNAHSHRRGSHKRRDIILVTENHGHCKHDLNHHYCEVEYQDNQSEDKQLELLLFVLLDSGSLDNMLDKLHLEKKVKEEVVDAEELDEALSDKVIHGFRFCHICVEQNDKPKQGINEEHNAENCNRDQCGDIQVSFGLSHENARG